MTATDELYRSPEQALPPPEEITNPRGERIALRYDINPILEAEIGPDWQRLCGVAVIKDAVSRTVDAQDESCREDDPDQKFELLITPADKIAAMFPVFDELYTGIFLDAMLAASDADSTPRPQSDFAAATNFISQFHTPTDSHDSAPDTLKRMDAHVDVRPTLILVVSAPVTGGELVVANNPDAKTVAEIEQDATVINHRDGTIIAFPAGQRLPHYARELGEAGIRIVASIDYLAPDQTQDDAHLQQINERIGITKPAEAA